MAEGDDLADLVDPRYEDLWVSADAATVERRRRDASTGDAEIDLPDLASIELDFDDDDD